MSDFKWYIIHTATNMENKVKDNIEKAITEQELSDLIKHVVIVNDVTEYKRGDKVYTREENKYPGYVFVNMIATSHTWFVLRNVKGVTSFVGPEAKLTPMTDSDVKRAGLDKFEETKLAMEDLTFKVGDTVRITSGIWADNDGVVKSIDLNKQTVTLLVNAFNKSIDITMRITDVNNHE